MIRPEHTRRNTRSPRRQSAGITASRENPRGFIRITAPIGIKWQLHRLCEVCEIFNCLVESEVLEVLGGENTVR